MLIWDYFYFCFNQSYNAKGFKQLPETDFDII